MNARVWAAALGASVLLHGVGLAALALTTQPEPVPDQPIPKSRFSIEAVDALRSRAAPQTPQADQVSETNTSPTSTQAGMINRTRARPAQPTTERLGAATPVAPLISADRAHPAIATAAAALAATALAALDAPIALSAVAAKPDASLSTAPLPSALQPAAALPLSPSPPAASNAPTVRPAALNAPAAQPAAQSRLQAQPLSLPATASKADLAWSGGQDTPISVASLAAIAAFTRQGDLAAASVEIRDGIAGILDAVPCARLQTTFIPETGQLELRGHIPQEGLRAPVLAALRGQVGDAIPLSDQLLILPRPQCGALAGIADIGLPQSTEQLTNPAVIGADGFARTFAYANGERLSLDLTAPDYDAYVYVDYFTADGSVIHLQPNDVVPLEPTAAKTRLSVGRIRQDGKPSLELTVSAPFGQEIAAAFAASKPLYEATRPIQEPADTYLKFLKERVAKARAQNADFKGEWVYFFITTSSD